MTSEKSCEFKYSTPTRTHTHSHTRTHTRTKPQPYTEHKWLIHLFTSWHLFASWRVKNLASLNILHPPAPAPTHTPTPAPTPAPTLHRTESWHLFASWWVKNLASLNILLESGLWDWFPFGICFTFEAQMWLWGLDDVLCERDIAEVFKSRLSPGCPTKAKRNCCIRNSS